MYNSTRFKDAESLKQGTEDIFGVKPIPVGYSSALTRQLTSEAKGGKGMFKDINFKRIVILFICIILITGGTAEAARPRDVLQNQEERGTVLLNLNRLSINPSLRYLILREEVIEKNEEIKKDRTNKESKNPYPEEDIELLARLVYAEAKGETYKGKVAVAATVLNRVENNSFPGTIKGVIYEFKNNSFPGTIKGVIYEFNHGYQYCPVRNGQINRPADEDSKKAVQEALRGKDPTGGALSFYNPAKSHNQWIRNRPYATTIGSHVFVK